VIQKHRWTSIAILGLAAFALGWFGCAEDKGIITEAPDHGTTDLLTQSTCYSCHISETLIEETTDYVPPAEGSSGAG